RPTCPVPKTTCRPPSLTGYLPTAEQADTRVLFPFFFFPDAGDRAKQERPPLEKHGVTLHERQPGPQCAQAQAAAGARDAYHDQRERVHHVLIDEGVSRAGQRSVGCMLG